MTDTGLMRVEPGKQTRSSWTTSCGVVELGEAKSVLGQCAGPCEPPFLTAAPALPVTGSSALPDLGAHEGFVQLFVEPARMAQFLMSAAFDDPAVVEHKDLICVGDGRQPVRNDD